MASSPAKHVTLTQNVTTYNLRVLARGSTTKVPGATQPETTSGAIPFIKVSEQNRQSLPQHFLLWLFTIIRHTCIVVLLKQQRKPAIEVVTVWKYLIDCPSHRAAALLKLQRQRLA